MSYTEAREKIADALPKGGVGAEIGVWQGDFSAHLLDCARPRLLHLIDLWEISDDPDHIPAWYGRERAPDMDEMHDSVRERFAPQIQDGTVQVHRARSDIAMAAFDDDSLDFAYLDGDHRYEAVRRDLEISFTKVRPGGFIVTDDYELGRWWDDGVVRAVHEFLGDHARELEMRVVGFNQVVMRRR